MPGNDGIGQRGIPINKPGPQDNFSLRKEDYSYLKISPFGDLDDSKKEKNISGAVS